MNYYDKVDNRYRAALHEGAAAYHTKVQFLDFWENVIAEMYADILTSDPANQTVGTGNAVRRSLTISVYDEDGRYSPNRDSFFWYKRKFKLLEGLEVGNDTYWISQGVYYTTHAEEVENILTINAVDKYGALNGETNSGRCVTAFSTDIASGDIIVADLIRETLGLNVGTLPIDPITPLIEPFFETQVLYADIALNAGQFYGEILTALADMYGADCYYDRQGRLNFRRKAVRDRAWFYIHQGYKWEFTENDACIIEGRKRSTDLKAINIVTVMSDNTEGAIASYTAKNTNPNSPACVQSIGEQYSDEPIVYISIGDTTRQTAEEKCQQYAEYILCQHTAQLCSETMTVAEIPHLDVDDVICYKGERRLITGLSIDHSTKLMQISMCSVNELPMNEVSI